MSAVMLISPQAGSQHFPAATATKVLHETISGCFKVEGEREAGWVQSRVFGGVKSQP